MLQRRDNYRIQLEQAKQRFLTYDQQELIGRCRLGYDSAYFYFRFLSEEHRICRVSGDMERFHGGCWVDANSFGEIMTVLDWLCDSREDRYIANRWVNVVNQSFSVHRSLQEDGPDPNADFLTGIQMPLRQPVKRCGGRRCPARISAMPSSWWMACGSSCSCGTGMRSFLPGCAAFGTKMFCGISVMKPPGMRLGYFCGGSGRICGRCEKSLF